MQQIESSGLQLLKRLPTGLGGAAFWLAVWFGLLFALRLLPHGVGTFFSVIQFFVGLALVIVAIPLLARFIRRRMLWSLKNKLVITYLLIGFAPVVLFVTFVLISGYVAAGQFSIHLVDSRIQDELGQLSGDNVHRTEMIARYVEGGLILRNPQADWTVGLDSANLRVQRNTLAYINGAPLDLGRPAGKTPLGLPPWAADLKDGHFQGLVLDGSDLYLAAIHQQRLNDGRLLSVVTSVPVDGQLVDLFSKGLGRVRLVMESFGSNQVSAVKKTTEQQIKDKVRQSARRNGGANTETSIAGGTEAPGVNVADVQVRFLSTLSVIDWDTGQQDSVPIKVDSRPSLLYQQLFGASLGGIITDVYRIGLIILFILFGAIEFLALIMAIRLSRTMTASVADLYEATQKIDRGELSHRIGVQRDDQLAELSRSFNTMTGSLQRLLQEQKEKERLQNELSIAQEVQANLFPQRVKNLERLELHGVCRPARSVSGDYYDFLIFQESGHNGVPGRETGLGLAIGDISGKGISAALLMATLHSAVRAYRFASEELSYVPSGNGVPVNGSANGNGHELFESPGRILSLLNRHLYRSTQPEKYATLFLAHYDADTSRLTYSNAGQLPPLLLTRDGAVRRLDSGGTVVGLFDGMVYNEDSLQMMSGDILIAYSDGVTEPENDFGEFGEERLLEVVSRYRNQPLHVISAQVMQALDAWIGAEEQPDDITLVLARQI
jgi:sigma-B regulation protein RsbU (phosphoserine phosphatase)